jgi:threonine-phosphate decarboxylase
VANPELAQRIASLLPTWPVTQLAMDALTDAVADREYEMVTLRENAAERERLAQNLREIGLTVSPSSANYLLVELNPNMPSSSELRKRLITTHRILIRNCDSYEGLTKGRFVRVAVRSAADNQSLISALRHEC